MSVIQPDDVSREHFKEIKEWKEKYLSIRDYAIDSSGALVEIDKPKEYKNLISTLVWLCVEIIEHNSRNTKKHQ